MVYLFDNDEVHSLAACSKLSVSACRAQDSRRPQHHSPGVGPARGVRCGVVMCWEVLGLDGPICVGRYGSRSHFK